MKINASLKQVLAEKEKGTHMPLFFDIPIGKEDPISVFFKLSTGSEYAFLLESVEGERKIARYSFIASGPYKVFESRKSAGKFTYKSGVIKKFETEDPFVFIQKALAKVQIVKVKGLPRFIGGAVGYLAYEGARYFEDIPKAEKNPLKIPDCMYAFYNTIIIYDHIKKVIKIVQLLELRGNIEKKYEEAIKEMKNIALRIKSRAKAKRLDFKKVDNKKLKNELKKTYSSNITQSQYIKGVKKAKEYISNGDIIQVVYSQRFKVPFKKDGFVAYQALRKINPSPYMYYLKFPQFEIAGSSPEVFARVEDGNIFVTALAGTRPRGKNDKEDKVLIKDLQKDEKENAEHVMLVDLARNDVGKVSEIGSVKVSKFKYVVKYSHVSHIASDIIGKLKKSLSVFDVFKSCFPRGTVSGAPKIRAMEIIAELEDEERGAYAGGIGYFDFGGNMNAALGIRTIVVKDGSAYIQAGAGIVYDSDPLREYQECVNKAKGPLKAVLMAKQL